VEVWNVLLAARWKYRTQKSRQKSPTIAQLCRAISSQLRHISTIGKNLLSSNMSSRCPPQYGELRPSGGWDRFGSLGHPYEFQRVLRLVWRVRGKVIRSVLCNIVWNNCAQCNAHTWTDLTVLWIGFCLTEPISLCVDSFFSMYYFVYIACMCSIVTWWGGPGGIEAYP